MRFLIVEDEDEIRELIKFNIEMETGTQVYEARNGTEAIELLQKLKDVDVIVCDYQMPGINGGQVQKFVINQNLKAKFVLSSAYEVENLADINPDKLYFAIRKPDISEGIENLFTKLRNNKNYEQQSTENKEYYQIAVGLIYKTGVCPCDLYLEINKNKILKILNHGDIFSEDDYQKYVDKKLEKLLVREEDLKACAHEIEKNIKVLFKNPTELEVEKSLDVQEYINDMVRKIGLSQDVITIAKDGVEFAVSIIKANKTLKKMLKKIFTKQKDFIPQHSVALSYVSCAIASKMQWNSEPTMVKLAFASLIHDVFIDSPKLIETEENLKPKKDKNFLEHTIKCSNELAKLADIPPDVDKIILEHHEQPDGSGFPKGIDHTKISPLSSLFIMAHSIVEIAMDLKSKGEDVTDKKIHQLLNKERYTKGNFKKILTSIEDFEIFGN